MTTRREAIMTTHASKQLTTCLKITWNDWFLDGKNLKLQNYARVMESNYCSRIQHKNRWNV